MADDIKPVVAEVAPVETKPAEVAEVAAVEVAAIEPERMTLAQFAVDVRLSVAERNHLMHVHEISHDEQGTAEEFAALLDATRKARI